MLALKITDDSNQIETTPAPISARQFARIQTRCAEMGIMVHYSNRDTSGDPFGISEFNGARLPYADWRDMLNRQDVDAVVEEATFKGRLLAVTQDELGQLTIAVSETLSFSDSLPQTASTVSRILSALEIEIDAAGRITADELAQAVSQSWVRHAFASAGLHDLYLALSRFVRGREAQSA